MGTEDSDIKCPFCKATMVSGYVTQKGIEGIVYFSREKLSWKSKFFGSLRDDPDEVLDGYPDNNCKVAYKCGNCNAILIEGRPNPAPAENEQAAESKIDGENLKDRARQMGGI